MFPNDFFIFLQIILFLFITPGPPRVVIVSHTLNYGVKKSVWTAFGDISANLCQGILVVFFIGTFLSDNPNILQALKWAGILYIIYLAYDTYTSRIKLINSGNKNLKSVFSFYRDGFLVAGLSPKSIIFFGYCSCKSTPRTSCPNSCKCNGTLVENSDKLDTLAKGTISVVLKYIFFDNRF